MRSRTAILLIILFLAPMHAIAFDAPSPLPVLEDAQEAPSPGGPASIANRPDSHSFTLPPTPYQAPGSKQMAFVCPGPGDGSVERVDLSVNMVYTCPVRIYDNTVGGNRGWLFGNVRLYVHPDRTDDMAFFTLHGGPADGPSGTSRQGLTHSTFPSDSGGTRFGDEWTTGNYPEAGALGEWASGTMDRDGNLYIAYTWSIPYSGAYDHLIRVYKGPDTSTAQSTLMDLYEESWYEVLALDPTNRIDQGQLVYVAQPLPDDDNLANETAPGEFGESAINQTNDDYVVLTYFEQPMGTDGEPTATGWIDAHWTHTGPGNSPEDWQWLNETERIGPCAGASDPVAWDGRVYIACVVDKGYDARGRARVGDVDIWSIDPTKGTTRFEGFTRIAGTEPRLAVTPDGYFAVMTSRVVGEQAVEVKASTGWYGHSWNSPGLGLDFGPVLHRAMGSQPILDAHITGIAIDPIERTVFAVYKEWNPEQAGVTLDPTDPSGTGLRLEGYHKFLFSFNECESSPIAGAEFMLGTSPDLYQRQAFEDDVGVFNDRQDGLQAVRMPTGEVYVWFVVSDYGAAQFGAVRAGTAASDNLCRIQPIPLPPPLAAIPQAASLTNPATTALGATLSVMSVAMIGYLVAARRRTTVAATTKDD